MVVIVGLLRLGSISFDRFDRFCEEFHRIRTLQQAFDGSLEIVDRLPGGAPVGAVLLVNRLFDVGQVFQSLLNLLHLQQAGLEAWEQTGDLSRLGFGALAVGEQIVTFLFQKCDVILQLGNFLFGLGDQYWRVDCLGTPPPPFSVIRGGRGIGTLAFLPMHARVTKPSHPLEIGFGNLPLCHR
ncbi:MAG: hypothetical protein ACK5N0_15705 [Synechococcaceae cyanobacterium]